MTVDTNGKKVSLSDYRGKWVVLYFYPKDNTPGCTREAIGFTESLAEFKKLGAEVVGVSADSCDSHQKFIKDQKLKITLISDPDHKLMDEFGVWALKKNYGKEYWGIVRSTFLIDPKGKTAHSWSNVKVDGHVDAVKAKLKELRG